MMRLVLLLAILTGLGAEAPRALAACPYDRLNWTYTGTLPKQVSLPRSVRVEGDVGDKYFSLIYQFWRSGIDFGRFEKLLTQVSKKEPLEHADAKYLKFTRKVFDLLRQGFVMFDESGESPKKLRAFTHGFGELNDLISNERWDEAAKAAARLKAALPHLMVIDYEGKFEEGIATTNLFAVAAQVRKNLEKMEDVTEPHELHGVRKDMKRFMNYFRLAYAANPTEENLKTFVYLKRLNEDLGDINDDVIRRGYEGDLSDDGVPLTPELRNRILTFLRRIDWNDR